MKSKRLAILVITLCMMTLPTKTWAEGTDTIPPIENKKEHSYPRATKVIPASEMEYDSVAECFVVREFDAENSALSLSAMSSTTKAAYAYKEDGVLYGYFGDQLSSDNMAEMKQIVE